MRAETCVFDSKLKTVLAIDDRKFITYSAINAGKIKIDKLFFWYEKKTQ